MCVCVCMCVRACLRVIVCGGGWLRSMVSYLVLLHPCTHLSSSLCGSHAMVGVQFSQRRSLDVSFNTKDDLTKVDHLEDLHTRLGVMIAHRRRDYAREVERLTRQLQQAQEDDDSRPTPETTEVRPRARWGG